MVRRSAPPLSDRTLLDFVTRNRAQELYVDIEYFAEVDEIAPLPANKHLLKNLSKFFIWSPEHVEDYIRGQGGAFLWLLRVHRLREPYVIGRTAGGGPPTWYSHPDEIPVAGAIPVVGDNDYQLLRKEILRLIVGDAAPV